MISNQRGIALIITLLIVSLLAITVVEFSFSVEVDQRMARNALNGLQATLLARSGINMGEAFLLRDDLRTQVDAFTEEWCPSPGPEAQSCQIDESNSEVVIPENMRLRVQIFDESGKFNVNWLRPANIQQWESWQNPATPSPLRVFERLCAGRGVDSNVPEALMEYWQNALNAATEAVGESAPGATPGASPGPSPAAATGRTAANAAQTAAQIKQILDGYEFSSVDDLGVIPGLTPSTIKRLRPVLTAIRGRPRVNINTAPRAVLNAILDDEEKVESIISQRQSEPLPNAQLAQTGGRAVPGSTGMPGLLGFTSYLFLIRASAIVNPDPMSGRGGIRRSASMLVRRDKAAGGARTGSNTGPGGLHWTLTQLDWQKEGGAALFETQDDSAPGSDDATDSNQDLGRMTN